MLDKRNKSVRVMQKGTIRHVNTEDTAVGQHRGGHEGQTTLDSKGRDAEPAKQKGKSEERRRGTLKQRGSEQGVDTEGAREGQGRVLPRQ